MIAVFKAWLDSIREYDGESVDWLTIVLCFIQSWNIQYKSTTRAAEELMKRRAADSTLWPEGHSRDNAHKIRFEDPIRGQQRRIIQFHKAQIALWRAKLRVQFYNLIRSSKREIAQRELNRVEIEHDWTVYDWFHNTRPIYLREDNQSSPSINVEYSSQDQSQLFRLPPEIRQIIYGTYLTGMTINLVVRDGGIFGPTRYDGRAYLDWGEVVRGRCTYCTRGWQGLRWKRRGMYMNFMNFGITKFILTCKRIHAEAIPILYGENLWNETIWQLNHGSMSLSRYLLPEQLCYINWLRFDLNLGGDLSLDALQSFPNLRRLYIRAFDFSPHSQFTGRQLWRRLESVFPALDQLKSTRITIFVEDCIPTEESRFRLETLQTNYVWFPHGVEHTSTGASGDLVIDWRVRPEA